MHVIKRAVLRVVIMKEELKKDLQVNPFHSFNTLCIQVKNYS